LKSPPTPPHTLLASLPPGQAKERELRAHRSSLYQLNVSEARGNAEALTEKHAILSQKLGHEQVGPSSPPSFPPSLLPSLPPSLLSSYPPSYPPSLPPTLPPSLPRPGSSIPKRYHGVTLPPSLPPSLRSLRPS
jgi:hypothetical protein